MNILYMNWQNYLHDVEAVRLGVPVSSLHALGGLELLYDEEGRVLLRAVLSRIQ